MRAVLLGLLLVFVSASNALAFGAVASGGKGRTLNFTSAYNEETYDAANAVSLQRCREQGLANCAVRWNFKNICIAVALAGNNEVQEGHGAIIADALEQMHANCANVGAGACVETVFACDQSASTASEDATANFPEVMRPPTDFDLFFGYLQLTGTLAVFAGLITLSLLVWVFVSIASATPLPVLKERVFISLWIGIPAALLFAFWSKIDGLDGPTYAAFLLPLLWTDAFTALILGGRLRQRLSPAWKPPAVLSLPLATLAFAIVSIGLLAIYRYFLTVEVIGCLFMQGPCRDLERHKVYAGLGAVAFFFMCGVVLPASSNLVLANDRLGALIRLSLGNFWQKRRQEREQAKQAAAKQEMTDGSYPVPALYAPATVDAMRLKLKRSQRSSLLGKPIFVLDARMELTREEYELVRKYRLGNDLVYESSGRQRRRKSTQAYLEMTKGGPGLRDFPGSQAWGIAKSFFWMGRAGISATTAALSLRITIDSLMLGVHVECKSMGELLEADRAIREAAQNLRAYIDVARTFDGREEMVEL